MNGQRQKFVEVEKVGVGDHWHVKDECELVLGRVVEVRDLDLEQVRSKSHKRHQVLLLGNGGDMLNNAIQDVMREGSWCKSMMLG